MTQDEIIELAREAGLHLYVNDMTEKPYAEIVVAFANLVAAKEREACAQVAFSWNFQITDKVAGEIRARGE